jgi:hypothetical protein
MKLVIHTTKSQVRQLMLVFGKLGYNKKGEQTLDVPKWLNVMLQYSKK